MDGNQSCDRKNLFNKEGDVMSFNIVIDNNFLWVAFVTIAPFVIFITLGWRLFK